MKEIITNINTNGALGPLIVFASFPKNLSNDIVSEPTLLNWALSIWNFHIEFQQLSDCHCLEICPKIANNDYYNTHRELQQWLYLLQYSPVGEL